MTTEELIESIFAKKFIFEKEVLNIRSEKDKSNIMHILATSLVRNILKEHLNFVYLNKLSDFTLKHIINILFKKIASEWVMFAMEILKYSREEALEELQKRNRAKYIHSLAEDYYRNYKEFFYEEISNSFIELLASMNPSSDKIKLVNAVINSDLIANRSILNINSFDQLYQRVISAKNSKNMQIRVLQIKISNILVKLDSKDISERKKEDLLFVLPGYKDKKKKMSDRKLEDFDASLKRVKMAIFNSLKNGLNKT